MAIAVNDAGDVLTDASGAWKPAMRAVNDTTGENLVLDGAAWRPVPGIKAGLSSDAASQPSRDAPMTPQQMYGGSSPTPEDAAAARRIEPDAAQRIGAAAVQGGVEGFGHPIGATILSPEAQDWMDARQREGGVGGFLAGLGSTAAEDIGTAGGIVAGAGNALFRSAQGAVAQTGAELGQPQLGRDIAAIPEAFMGSPGMLGHVPEPNGGVFPTDRPYVPRSVDEGNLLLNVPRPTDVRITAREVQARDGVDIMEAWNRAHAENTAKDIAAIGSAPDIDGAIAAAGKAAEAPSGAVPDEASLVGRPGIYGGTPDVTKGPFDFGGGDLFGAQPGAAPTEASPYVPITSTQVQRRDGVGAIEAGRRADAENAANAPVPESIGAAASRDMTNPNVADISSSDMKANRRVAEMGEILAPPQPGDTMIHVPGSFPTLAEYTGDPVKSQYENLLRQRKADQFFGEGKRLTENNKARVALYDDNTVPDTTLNSMRNDRLARWTAASGDILPNARPVDLTPVHDWALEQLSNPRIQENDAVRGVLSDFENRLVDNNGNLKTDPAAVWGIHDNLQNQLAKAKDPLNATGAEKFAQSQILQAKGLVDQAMNVATDNRFQSALDNYAEDSKAINAGVLLNDFRPKLTNMSGELQPAAFHRFVVNLAKERGDPGIDPSMDVSDQAMRALINIDTDLKRAGLIRLGAAAGSPTNLLGALAEKAGLNAAHSIVGKIPGVGGLLSEGAKYIADRKLTADAAKHLAPPEGGYTYPEPEEPSAGPSVPNMPPPAAGGPGGASGAGSLPLFRAAPPAPSPAPAPASGWRPVVPGEVFQPGGQYRMNQTTGQSEVFEPRTPAPPPSPLPDRPTTGAGPGESIAFTPSGAAVAVRYTARDASDLIASQLPDGRTNPAYPAALQPRDRTRAASIQQVNSIANRLQPERLGASASTSEGAPIIGPDGAVESGNGRTMAIMQAYADGGPLADAYRQWVAAQGHDTAGMKNPVLVRERLGDLDMPARARLAADMGASPVAAMSAPERAAADARAIPADILSMYRGGDVTLAKNAAFARAFADHVIPPSEQAGFITANGEMSADGAIRMRNALTQHAYGSNSLVTSLAENADPDIKAFGGALMDASGDMAKLRGAIDSGTVSRASDIAPDIVAAAQLIQTARRQRISLADAVGQRDAFSVLPEKTEDILQAAFGENYSGRMSRARMADLLSSFAQEAQMQSGLFGANLTAGEMLAEARAKYGYGTKAGAKGGSGIPVGNGPGLDLNRP